MLDTYIALSLSLLAHIEGNHGGYGIYVDQEHAFLLPILGKLQQKGKVLCQMLAVWPDAMFNLFGQVNVK